jgi:DNA invertase Pin-like site-specific DNA recombinase
MRNGYSYLRYSSITQGDGDSVRRQTAATENWCKRHNVKLDSRRTYLEKGKSAFSGKHRRNGTALAAFLDEVETGRIPGDSVLIIENLDRLSRENPWNAVPLLCNLVNAGISVVSLNPSEVIYERGSDMSALIVAVLEFARGHSESKSKSTRIAAAWSNKRQQARENGKVMTKHLPGWLETRGGKIVLKPVRATLVKRIFELAASGDGLSKIVQQLDQDKTPTWGKAATWSKAYVHKILTSRAVLGECLPQSKAEPNPKPIPNYYPAIIEPELFNRVQGALDKRRLKPGRVGLKVASLFTGLLREAGSGQTIYIAWQVAGGNNGSERRKHRLLVSARSAQGIDPIVSFPYEVFETALLSLLKEVTAADVIGEEPSGASALVAAELAQKESRIGEIEAELKGDGDIPAAVRVLRELTKEADELRKRLASLRQEEGNPRSELWQEARTLLDLAKDENQRVRLRSVLGGLVDEITVLTVRRQSHRFLVAQVWFRSGGVRDVAIWTRAVYGHAREWKARSLFNNARSKDIDLRRRDDARALQKMLATTDLDELVAKFQD